MLESYKCYGENKAVKLGGVRIMGWDEGRNINLKDVLSKRVTFKKMAWRKWKTYYVMILKKCYPGKRNVESKDAEYQVYLVDSKIIRTLAVGKINLDLYC